MEYLGEYEGRKVYWWCYSEETLNELPSDNWICFAMEEGAPEPAFLDKFIRTSIKNGILEFKAFGESSSVFDDWFDEIAVELEGTSENGEIDVMTTWHDNEELATAFWQCFHATCLPDSTDLDKLSIVCLHFSNYDYRKELKAFIGKFNAGWIPEDHE